MKIKMRIIALAVAVVSTAGLGTLAVVPALADAGTVTAVAHASQHPDTTSASGPGCGTSANGPTWALDNLSRQFSVTDNADGTYTVMITDHGSFAGFADPVTCQPLTSGGSISGSYTLTVTSPHGPDPSGLAPQYEGAISTTTMVQDLFDQNATSIVGGAYYYSYQHGNYVQSSQAPYTTGDVIGH